MSRNIIFVDFFDTLMLRHIHPYQVTERWADNVRRRFAFSCGAKDIVRIRRESFSAATKEKTDASYTDAMNIMYDKLAGLEPSLPGVCTKDVFAAWAKETELALETGVLYPDNRLLARLAREKSKGASVYIVSDFYLGADDLRYFLSAHGADLPIFDGIFVSCECGAQKYDGSLYRYVLTRLGADPSAVLMIGDSKHSDGKMARKNGIHAELHRRMPHKALLRVRRINNYDFSKRAGKCVTSKCYKYGQPFAEYISIYFSFTEKLKNMLVPEDHAVFLSREGYFLKRLFETYDRLAVPAGEENPTYYFLCSRKAVNATQPDVLNIMRASESLDVRHYLLAAGYRENEVLSATEDAGIKNDDLEKPADDSMAALLSDTVARRSLISRKAMLDYAHGVLPSGVPDNNLHFIDIGWRGTMQKGIEALLGISTKGYYLGTDGRESEPLKTGLIFSEDEQNRRQTFYQVLRANTQLYELLAAAPHGSVQSYIPDSDGSPVSMEWAENEKALYYDIIKDWQDNTVPFFAALSAWTRGGGKHTFSSRKHTFTNRQNAYLVLRSALFADRTRLEFLKKLDRGFIQNIGQDVKGLSYDKKKVKINLSALYAPERYVRFAAKLQRTLPEKALIQALYRAAAHCFSFYVKMLLWLKRAK